MLGGLIGGLITGWVLNWFNVADMVIDVLQPFVSVELTHSHYYVFLGIVGLIGGAFSRS